MDKRNNDRAKLEMPFEDALKKALNTPLPKKTKKLKPWLGLPLDLEWFSGLFGKKPL